MKSNRRANGNRPTGKRGIRILAVIAALAVLTAITASNAYAVDAASTYAYGNVVEAERGIPLFGVRVDLLQVQPAGAPVNMGTVYTDAEGAWRASLPVGEYVIRFSSDA